MDLRDLPRVVWVLAAARFVSSAASFTMLFLTLYLTGPRAIETATAGLVAGGVGVRGAEPQSAAKPGSDSSRISRKGAVAPSWLSSPMPPSQVRWIRR